MDSNKVKISSLQLGILIVVSVVGVGILTLPRGVVEIAGPDGWLLILIAGLITLVSAMIIYALGSRFPGQTIIEYSRELIGRPLTILLGVILVGYYICFAAFTVRVFGEVLKMFLLPRTPYEVIAITFLLTAVYLVRNGIQGIVRFYEIILVLMIVPYILTIASGAYDGDYTNLLPMFQTPPILFLKGAFQVFFSFIGFEAILLFMPFVSDQKNIKKTLNFSILGITFLYVITVILVIGSFGVEEVKNLSWPLMSYIKGIEVPGAFIEQLEGVMMTVWVLFIFTTLSTLYYSCTFVLSKIMKSREHKGFAIILLPIIYLLSLQPDNVAQTYEWLNIFSIYAGTIVVFIIPILLLLIAVLRKKGGKAHG